MRGKKEGAVGKFVLMLMMMMMLIYLWPVELTLAGQSPPLLGFHPKTSDTRKQEQLTLESEVSPTAPTFLFSFCSFSFLTH
jgi:hypothetical protein